MHDQMVSCDFYLDFLRREVDGIQIDLPAVLAVLEANDAIVVVLEGPVPLATGRKIMGYFDAHF